MKLPIIGCLPFLFLISLLGYGQDDESVMRGKDIYQVECQYCHMQNGEGIPGVFPPVAIMEYSENDLGKVIKAITEGVSGETMVNGVKYFGEMSSIPLNDQEIADVVNYMLKLSGRGEEFVSEKKVQSLK